MPIPREVEKLVGRFDERRNEYESPLYLEARLRVDFLNPMFSALGWDVSNAKHLSEQTREVVTEGRIRSGGSLKAPDYVLRANGDPILVVEAKKPSVNLREDPAPALQLRRYGWNSPGIAIGILTDFQELAVYDCTIPPDSRDQASVAVIDYYTYDQYAERWDEIESWLSRDSVAEGSLQVFSDRLADTRGKRRVDKLFLQELETWRAHLAVAIAADNNLTVSQLNSVTHATIDRLIFLRICEDRGIEPYGALRAEAKGTSAYRRIYQLFQRADEKYNSGLFHFKSERGRTDPDVLAGGLQIRDEVLSPFIQRLYWPEGPYDFAVFPPDILGQVYEQFLGSTISLQGDSNAVVEEKPEVRKAGGVYYTPAHVVKDIVNAVLVEQLAGQNPTTLARRGIRICDPSCGSGTFLLQVYEYLLAWHLEYYSSNQPERWMKTRPGRLQTDALGRWRLTVAERKRILLAHVFGVDIDEQAVEVSKLSLLLKLLEGESESSIFEQFELFHERVLPDLENNIKCGNSLVTPGFSDTTLYDRTDDEADERVNAFDWRDEFPDMDAAAGFDVIVGNPPWLMAGYYVTEIVPYLKTNYRSAAGKFDLYYVFLEQAIKLLKPGGALGMIVPNKFFHTKAAANLRELLASRFELEQVKDFGTERIFEGATNYSCILIGRKGEPVERVRYIRARRDLRAVEDFSVPMRKLTAAAWQFEDQTASDLFEHMRNVGDPLENLVDRFATGIQSGSDKLLAFTAEDARSLGLEADLLRPVLRGRDVRAYSISKQRKLLLFPYSEEGGHFRLLSTQELSMYPNAWSYLRQNRAKLSSRIWFGKDATELSGAWYGLMYVEVATSFQRTHLLTPSLAKVSSFAQGAGDLFATGTAGVTGLVLGVEMARSPAYLLGILNSSLLSVYATEHSPIYQGGFHKFSAPYLRSLPVIPPGYKVPQERRVADLSVTIGDAVARASVSESVPQRRVQMRRAASARRTLDEAVFDLYGISAEQRAWVAQRSRSDAPSDFDGVDVEPE